MYFDSAGRGGAALTWKDPFAGPRLSRDLQQGRAPLEAPQLFASHREEADTVLRRWAETSPPCSAQERRPPPASRHLPVPLAMQFSPTSQQPFGKSKVSGESLHESS